jgi:hypothetical protein
MALLQNAGRVDQPVNPPWIFGVCQPSQRVVMEAMVPVEEPSVKVRKEWWKIHRKATSKMDAMVPVEEAVSESPQGMVEDPLKINE